MIFSFRMLPFFLKPEVVSDIISITALSSFYYATSSSSCNERFEALVVNYVCIILLDRLFKSHGQHVPKPVPW